MEGICNFPKCHNQAAIGYMNKEICEKHWEQLCLATESAENKLLKKINLYRNTDGKVVPID